MCSACDWERSGLLEENPQCGCSDICASLKGPLILSRLYWYYCRGVTVLLPGWVIWKYWNYPCKFFSLGSWLVSALSTPNGGEGYNSSPDFNPNTITSIQLQCIQTASPHLAEKPQAISIEIFSSSTSVLCLYVK